MRLDPRRLSLLLAVCALTACTAPASSAPGTSPGTDEPAPPPPPPPVDTPRGLVPSTRNNLRFKGPQRLSLDFATALSLPEGQLCNELGQYACTSSVHNVTLGGVDPYSNSLYEALPASGVTTPIAIERVALAACGQRVTLDVTTPSTAVLFKAIPLDAQGRLVDRQGEPVKAALSALYQRGLLRDPTKQEVDALVKLSTDIETTASTQPGQDWMKAACFVVFSSAESVFF